LFEVQQRIGYCHLHYFRRSWLWLLSCLKLARRGAPRRASGQRVKHEEVGLYTVKNDLVTREEFFYDGSFI
jgi:hypothetical protein